MAQQPWFPRTVQLVPEPPVMIVPAAMALDPVVISSLPTDKVGGGKIDPGNADSVSVVPEMEPVKPPGAPSKKCGPSSESEKYRSRL
jgi:hypothetical protein